MDFINDICETLLMGIEDLNNLPKNIQRDFCINQFKSNLNYQLSDLSMDEAQQVSTHIESLLDYANNLKEKLSTSSSISVDEEETSTEQSIFFQHVLEDMRSSAFQIETIDLTLEVINIAMEELRKYLPSNPSVDGSKKKLVLEDGSN